MIDKAKLALIGAVAAVLFASPALAQAGVHDARRNGLHAYAIEPQHARRKTLVPKRSTSRSLLRRAHPLRSMASNSAQSRCSRR